MNPIGDALKNKMKLKGPPAKLNPPSLPGSDAKEDTELQEADRAPSVDDSGHASGHPDGPDGEINMLKGMTNGPQGRGSMTLGEKAQDGMKERMAAIMKEKKKKV